MRAARRQLPRNPGEGDRVRIVKMHQRLGERRFNRETVQINACRFVSYLFQDAANQSPGDVEDNGSQNGSGPALSTRWVSKLVWGPVCGSAERVKNLTGRKVSFRRMGMETKNISASRSAYTKRSVHIHIHAYFCSLWNSFKSSCSCDH